MFKLIQQTSQRKWMDAHLLTSNNLRVPWSKTIDTSQEMRRRFVCSFLLGRNNNVVPAWFYNGSHRSRANLKSKIVFYACVPGTLLFVFFLIIAYKVTNS